jgi:hypothetical protein
MLNDGEGVKEAELKLRKVVKAREVSNTNRSG